MLNTHDTQSTLSPSSLSILHTLTRVPGYTHISSTRSRISILGHWS